MLQPKLGPHRRDSLQTRRRDDQTRYRALRLISRYRALRLISRYRALRLISRYRAKG